jgi:4-amino-4-deoxy-L-arabinose transferase-like glycosyltransferase
MLNDVLFLVSIVALYLFVKDWYGKRTGCLSALFYGIFMSVPTIEGLYALASSFSLSFFIFSLYFCNKYLEAGKRWLLYVSGMLMSSALLICQQWAVGLVLLLIIVIFSRRTQSTKTARSLAKDSIAGVSTLIGGMILLISAFIIYFWSHGALYDLIRSTVIEFMGYASYGSFMRAR